MPPLLEARGQLVRVGRVMREWCAATCVLPAPPTIRRLPADRIAAPCSADARWSLAGSEQPPALPRSPPLHAPPPAVQDPADARQLLRSGVFKGLRDNVRSLGEYASERAGDDSGRALVKGFFAELEGLDAALRQVRCAALRLLRRAPG